MSETSSQQYCEIIGDLYVNAIQLRQRLNEATAQLQTREQEVSELVKGYQGLQKELHDAKNALSALEALKPLTIPKDESQSEKSDDLQSDE